ncbi:hypothetical protein ISF_06946 [Cordyceps fumosorosea ARSEF 2679]|uniref:25S rRNA (Uridine(2843)-N(3))-methyltransferase n=1 Tax=Cordyceps fumosorosea (strain ARSEF 2679) TaxID=1081104 RepID=A0A167QJR7_CORFA|nr:hypothetical protein ISF_06946 [Cordyceps fumosorosea ARSEF 2679]OAA57705.1 hypothetical protein ISF_06946 [Cordyceps fumosorosea ARSEF 2679]
MVRKQPNTKQKKPATRASASASSPNNPLPTPSTTDDAPPQLSIPRQQRLLDLFAAAFAPALAAPSLPAELQAIKQALYLRDFAAAFGRPDRLAAYAARWSPTRALCYAGVFRSYLPAAAAAAAGGRTRMICVGGCAAEHVAFASYLEGAGGDLTLVDAAPWGEVAERLQEVIAAPPPLSSYASAAARAANGPLVEAGRLRPRVLQRDALRITDAEWAELLLAPAGDGAQVVVTLLFTLNELYTSGGVAATTRFLAALGAALPDAALLLVVDSPGSYSEAAVGKDSKRYPMQWLLHHTLTEQQAGAATAWRWTRLESHDSLWFRLSDQLTYPIQLENMRYQLHLYRIDKTPST